MFIASFDPPGLAFFDFSGVRSGIALLRLEDGESGCGRGNIRWRPAED